MTTSTAADAAKRKKLMELNPHAFDERGVVKPGHSIRVPQMMFDHAPASATAQQMRDRLGAERCAGRSDAYVEAFYTVLFGDAEAGGKPETLAFKRAWLSERVGQAKVASWDDAKVAETYARLTSSPITSGGQDAAGRDAALALDTATKRAACAAAVGEGVTNKIGGDDAIASLHQGLIDNGVLAADGRTPVTARRDHVDAAYDFATYKASDAWRGDDASKQLSEAPSEAELTEQGWKAYANRQYAEALRRGC